MFYCQDFGMVVDFWCKMIWDFNVNDKILGNGFIMKCNIEY